MSATTLAAAPICERNSVVLLSPVASSPLLSDAGSYVFRIWPPDTFEARFVAHWATEQQLESVSVIYVNDEFGVPLRDAIKTEFQEQGGVVLQEQAFTARTPNFRPVIRSTLAAKPDLVYLIAHYSEAATLVRLMREENFSGVVVGTNSLNNPAFLREAGSAAFTISFPNRVAFDPQSTDPTTKEFLDSFQTKFGRQPGVVEAQAYDAASLILKAYNSGSSTGEEVRSFLRRYEQETYAGVTGTIRFDSSGDLASADFRMVRFNSAGGMVTVSEAE